MSSRRFGTLLVNVLLSTQAGIAADYYGDSFLRLKESLAAAVGPEEASRIAIPFEIDPALIARARHLTPSFMGPKEKSRRLLDFILDKNELNLAYDPAAAGTARDAYERQIGNCLARTSLFVGLARAVSLDARYVHVTEVTRFTEGEQSMREDDPQPTEREDYVVHSSHICAGVRDGGQTVLVDFVTGPTRQYRAYRLIDDIEALAHHYTNKAFEIRFRSQASTSVAATDAEVECYETAIRIKPDFYPAYNNLGTVHSRRGDIPAALRCFAKAVEINPTFADAHSNIASIYCTQGRLMEAVHELELAVSCDPSNPYFRSSLGDVYYALGRYADAEACYERAISRGRSVRFYLGRGRALVALGRNIEAALVLRKALELSPHHLEALRLLGNLQRANERNIAQGAW